MRDQEEKQRVPEEPKSHPAANHYSKGNNKLDVHNWLQDIPETGDISRVVEIRFKNTRKGFYHNVNDLRLQEGDLVAVEASPGHDIGWVSLCGELVKEHIKHHRIPVQADELKRIYRKAKHVDIQKWEEAKRLEVNTMLQARKIAEDLRLRMKIGDVEYQGDKTKAIFYYIAEERVDFRELIKVLAERFRIRIEMRQIGARQEAGRIGGIGACGRELCCSTWITNFVSVTTMAARFQELALNPQKLAGQCGKLKCCLNYEMDCYADKQHRFPPKEIPLHTSQETYYYHKMEVFKDIFWYATDPNVPVNLTAVPVERVREIQKMNKNGKKPPNLVEYPDLSPDLSEQSDMFHNEDITRFENKNKQDGKLKKHGKPRRKRKKRNRPGRKQ